MSEPTERTACFDTPEIAAKVTLIKPADDRHSGKLEIYKVTVELLKVLVWPSLLLLFLSEFRGPIRKIVDQLPDKLSQATKVSFGNVTLEIIAAKAREAGSLDIAEKLGQLSPRAVEVLLNTGKNTRHRLVSKDDSPEGGTRYTFPADSTLEPLLELQKRGFLTFTQDYSTFRDFMAGLPLKEDLTIKGGRRFFKRERPLSPDQEQQFFDQWYSLTREGEGALDAVIAAVSEQLTKRKPSAKTTDE